MENIIDKFTLQEIANWQLESEKSIVELPSIQRGFVWKPKQVEDLWDSLLREYPIGSFLFSNTGEKLFLMDGQQRATSIFLGYFNPFNPNNATNAWSIKGELPVVWIDLKPKAKTENSKYLIRLTTRSHPWGYQAISNNTKLSVADRRNALALFREHKDNKIIGYTSFKNTSVFPYDCSFPLPLSFFIDSKNINEVIEKAEKYLPSYIKTKNGGFDNKEAFIKLLKADLTNELNEICNVVRKLDQLYIKSNIISDNVLNEEQESENPTLFVRINSSGTTLNGDDLIYSIYKASFPDAKGLIEKIGMNFIEPTQVLSMIARIVASDLNKTIYIKKMSVGDFQRSIKKGEFKNKLIELVQSVEFTKLFEQVIHILSLKENKLFEGEILPVIIKQLIKNNQDIFLFFIYWLYQNKLDNISDDTQLKMVAKLFSFAWFKFGNVPRLWNEKIKNKNFWEEPLNELIWWDDKDGIHFMIDPNLLRDHYRSNTTKNKFLEHQEDRWRFASDSIMNYFKSVKPEATIDREITSDYFSKFIEIIFHNKLFILFAQREYINQEFKDYNQMDNIDDTNTPWDWDHIYPTDWVYNKQCKQIIKDWNGSNGNFRAISLEQNRSESNNLSPKARLEDEHNRKISFVLDNDWKDWQKIESRIDTIVHFNAITSRMINIYEKFWNDLKIDDLIKQA